MSADTVFIIVPISPKYSLGLKVTCYRVRPSAFSHLGSICNIVGAWLHSISLWAMFDPQMWSLKGTKLWICPKNERSEIKYDIEGFKGFQLHHTKQVSHCDIFRCGSSKLQVRASKRLMNKRINE